MNLSARLQRIADFVPDGGVMADVGTDHGHLPIYLVSSHKVERAIAMDVRTGPLSRAQQAIRAYGLEKQISVRLSDGLTALEPGEVDTVVMAGMGGFLIQKLLGQGEHMWDSVSRWILSPHSEIGETRHWLEEHGFSIQREDMVLDANKFYVIMDVVRGSMHYDHEYEYKYGEYLIRTGNPQLEKYLELELKKLYRLMKRIKVETPRCLVRMKQLQEKENRILDALEAVRRVRSKAD